MHLSIRWNCGKGASENELMDASVGGMFSLPESPESLNKFLYGISSGDDKGDGHVDSDDDDGGGD